MRHRDAKLLDAIEAELGGNSIELRAKLDVTSQVLHNWKVRGIAPGMRAAVAKIMRSLGQTPPREWQRCPLCGQAGFLKPKRSSNHGRASESA
jgi:hypothetical protein